MATATTERRTERWHVGKEIPLALIFTLFVQTGWWIWWAATQSAKLDNLSEMVSKLVGSQYTQADARRDKEIYTMKADEMMRRIQLLETDHAERRTP